MPEVAQHRERARQLREQHTAKLGELKQRLGRLHNAVRLLEAVDPSHAEHIEPRTAEESSSQKLGRKIEAIVQDRQRDIDMINETQPYLDLHRKITNKNAGLEESIASLEAKAREKAAEPEVRKALTENFKRAVLEAGNEGEVESIAEVHGELLGKETVVKLLLDASPEAKDLLRRGVEGAASLEEEQAHIARYKHLLTPAEADEAVARGREPVAHDFIDRFKSAQGHELGVLTNAIIARLGPKTARDLVNMARTQKAAEEERSRREMLRKHDEEVSAFLRDPSLRSLFDGTDSEGRRVTAFERPEHGDGFIISDGSTTQVSMASLEKEMAKLGPPKDVGKAPASPAAERASKEFFERAVAAPKLPKKELGLEELDDKPTPTFADKLRKLGEPKAEEERGPLPDRMEQKITDLFGDTQLDQDVYTQVEKWGEMGADPSFMISMLGKPADETREILQALELMKAHGIEKGIRDFTGRVAERDWGQVLEIARGINKLKNEPKRLRDILVAAERASFEESLRMFRNIQAKER